MSVCASQAPPRVVVAAPRRGSTHRRRCGSLVAAAASPSGKTAFKVTLLPGDGIGPEIMKVAVDCLNLVVRAPRHPHSSGDSPRQLPWIFPASRGGAASSSALLYVNATLTNLPNYRPRRRR